MKETFDNYIETGKKKVSTIVSNTLVLAMFAGAFIAIAGVASTICSYGIENVSVAKLISALVFPMGLILVILFKTELFTGNSLLVIPLIKKEIKFKDLIKNLIIVYIGNFIGAIVVALMLKSSGHYDNKLYLETVLKIASVKVSYSFLKAFILGILCNILVCMAVLISFSVKDTFSKVIVIFIPIFLFIALGLEHSVANMYYLTAGYLNNGIGLKAILNNLIPVTLGNIVGGMGFGTIYYLINRK